MARQFCTYVSSTNASKSLKMLVEWHWGDEEEMIVNAKDHDATMAFQTGLNPPGGVWQEYVKSDEDGDGFYVTMTPGYSNAASRFEEDYTNFVYFNTASLVASLSTILLMISGFPLKNRFYLWLLMLTMCSTIVFILKTYLISLYLFTATNKTLKTTKNAIQDSGKLWIGLYVVVISLHSLRFLVWVVKKWRARLTQRNQQTGTLSTINS